MSDRYRNEAAGLNPIIEERESARFLHSIEAFVLSPAGRGAFYWAFIGMGIGFVLLAVAYDRLWLMLPGLGFSFSGMGGLFMLQQRLAEFQPQRTFARTEYGQTVTHAPESKDITLDLGNNLPPQRIWQPEPGAFRKWLTDVLDPNGKKQFSLREGRQRGWSDEQYNFLVTQLREVGLLHKTAVYNHAPVCTDEGKQKAREWLKR
jgi:hypothetical protein